MKLYTDESLRNFDFWAGAADTAEYLTDGEMNRIESMLEIDYPDGMEKTELNDLFWHERDQIAKWLGYEDFDAIMRRDEDDEDEEDTPE